MVYIKRLVVLLLCVFIICGCTHNTENMSDNLKFKYEYEDLNNKKVDNNKLRKVKINKDNNIKYSSIDKIVKLIDEK